MDLQAMARDISLKLEAAGFPRAEAATRQVFNLAEEVGEFVGAYRRWKGMARRTGSFEDVARELADVVITAYVTAIELDIDLDGEISSKLEVIYSRGWHEGGKQAEQAHPHVWREGGQWCWLALPEDSEQAQPRHWRDKFGQRWRDAEPDHLVMTHDESGTELAEWEPLRRSKVEHQNGPLTEVIEGGDV